MFRPIKNFIDFIQKNASSGAGIGAPCAAADGADAPLQSSTPPPMSDAGAPAAAAALDERKEQHVITEPEEERGSAGEENACPDVGGSRRTAVEFYEDATEVSPNESFESFELNPRRANHCDRTADEDDSVGGDEKPVGAPFLDMSATFPGSEIVVLNDLDLSSCASDTPLEDPLALDDSGESITPNPLDVSTLSNETDFEGSASADRLWIDLDEIKKDAPALKGVAGGAGSCDSGGGATLTPTAAGAGQRPKADEIRSDGSDSGLGSETSSLQTTIASALDVSLADSAPPYGSPAPPPIEPMSVVEVPPALPSSSDAVDVGASAAPMDYFTAAKAEPLTCLPTHPRMPPLSPLPPELLPIRSNLKRRLADDDDDDDVAGLTPTSGASKRPRRCIAFDAVQIYYFPRQQGFGCVPSAGGCTLGMGPLHVGYKNLSLSEHAAELRRAHRLQLQDVNRASSSEETEESEEDCLSECSGSDLDAESNGFLQPVSPKQRRALLKAAGVRKIDAGEKAECRDIRNSREVCGCSCRDFCDPETCGCSRAGIKCQVDRSSFPCGCSRDACGNVAGRIEFNPTRVRTHFIHTIMRLKMENRPPQPTLRYALGASVPDCVVPPPTHPAAAASASGLVLPTNFYGIQPASNFSSGYASPAYSGDHATANFYTPQSGYADSGDGGTTPGGGSGGGLSNHSSYSLDSLDSGFFMGGGGGGTTPVYGGLLSGFENGAAVTIAPSYHHAMSYPGDPQSQMSPYGAFAHLSHYQTPAAAAEQQAPPFSSCAVPSVPPCGAATTTPTTTDAPSDYEHLPPQLRLIDDDDDGAAADVADATVELEADEEEEEEEGSSFIDLDAPAVDCGVNDLLQQDHSACPALAPVAAYAGLGAAESPLVPVGAPFLLPTELSVESDVKEGVAKVAEAEAPQAAPEKEAKTPEIVGDRPSEEPQSPEPQIKEPQSEAPTAPALPEPQIAVPSAPEELSVTPNPQQNSTKDGGGEPPAEIATAALAVDATAAPTDATAEEKAPLSPPSAAAIAQIGVDSDALTPSASA